MSKPLGNKFKIKSVTTPLGIAIWPSIVVPDQKFNKIGSKLRITAEAADAFRDVLQPILDAAVKKWKEESGAPGAKIKTVRVAALPITEELDRDTGDPTGYYLINPTRTGSGVSKKDGKPWKAELIIKDAKGNVIPKKGLQVWSGSEMRFNVDVCGYYFAKDNEVGITLDPVAVQIKELRAGGGVNDEFGELDGYEHTNADAAEDEDTGHDGDETDF